MKREIIILLPSYECECCMHLKNILPSWPLFTNQRKASIPLLAFQLLNTGLGEISQWLEHWLFFHRS